jgi:hypothetical protein
VLGGGQITTYTVMPATGLLSQTGVEDVPGSKHFIAADPTGRFLFLGFLPTGETRTLLRSYFILPETGTLALADQQYAASCQSMAATERVVLLSCASANTTFFAYVLDEAGFLERRRAEGGYWLEHPYCCRGFLSTDPASQRLYVTGVSGDVVYAVELHVETWQVVLGTVAAGWLPEEDARYPLVDRHVAAGSLLVTASSGGWLTTFQLVSGEDRMVRRASLQAAGPLLAYAAGVLVAASADGRVETYAVGPSEELTLKKATALPVPIESLAFHPSGRFLYVSGPTLSTYVVEADGSLRPYGAAVPGKGQLVVTEPPRS